MNTTVLEKTRELGESLVNSEEYTAMKDAQTAMETDAATSTLLKQLSELEADIRLTMEKPELSELFLQSKMDRYQKMQKEANDNELVKAYQAAATSFQQLMNQVNSVINFCLTGEAVDPDAAEGGCTGNCATCHSCPD